MRKNLVVEHNGASNRPSLPKSWKSCCKEIWQDEDGWWATLKPGYFWGIDNNTVFNGETYKQLIEEAKYIHR